MESVKFTATREVKNLRKEMNKRNRPVPPRNKPVSKEPVNTESAVAVEVDGEKPKPRRNPNPNANRQRNYRPKKKPILKNPEDSPAVNE
jgi:hypothetical protein